VMSIIEPVLTASPCLLQGPEMRKKLGIKDNLIRFSTGVEDMEDIWADLERALARI